MQSDGDEHPDQATVVPSKPSVLRASRLKWIVLGLSLAGVLFFTASACIAPFHLSMSLGSKHDGHFLLADSRVTLCILSKHVVQQPGPLTSSRTLPLWSFDAKRQVEQDWKRLKKNLEATSKRLRATESGDPDVHQTTDTMVRMNEAFASSRRNLVDSLLNFMQSEIRGIVKSRGWGGMLLATDTHPRSAWVLSVPVWPPFGLAALGVLISVHRFVRLRRLLESIDCAYCLYCLRGLTRDTCPECGMAIPEHQLRLIAKDRERQVEPSETPMA